MRLYVGWLLAAFMLSSMFGCQCNKLYEPYGDLIDDATDKKVHLDCLYTPCLDLTRIGRSDWCECRGSGLFCRRGCQNCRESGHSHYQHDLGLSVESLNELPDEIGWQ